MTKCQGEYSLSKVKFTRYHSHRAPIQPGKGCCTTCLIVWQQTTTCEWHWLKKERGTAKSLLIAYFKYWKMDLTSICEKNSMMKAAHCQPSKKVRALKAIPKFVTLKPNVSRSFKETDTNPLMIVTMALHLKSSGCLHRWEGWKACLWIGSPNQQPSPSGAWICTYVCMWNISEGDWTHLTFAHYSEHWGGEVEVCVMGMGEIIK